MRNSFLTYQQGIVTPYAGVWIEMAKDVVNNAIHIVTPYAGVWIEICNGNRGYYLCSVTPYAGVWIEISGWR